MSEFVGSAARRRGVAVLIAVAVALAVAAAALAGGGPAGAAQPKYPVPYTFLTSALLAAPNADADPPGANDWSCRPSAAHPEPVVLVHGLAGNKNTNWQTFAPLLADNGYCVFALTYGVPPGATLPLNQLGGFTTMESSAEQLAAFVDRVLAATHASKVDILGHSEGTVVPDYYAKFLGGAAKIAKYVSLAPIWHGTNPAGLATLDQLARRYGLSPVVDGTFGAYFASGPQLLAGSAFVATLRSGGTPAVPGHRLHQHRHEVRRARGALHQRDPGRDAQHHRAGPVRPGPQRPPADRRRPGRGRRRAQRARPGAPPAGPVRVGAALRLTD